MMKVRSCYGLLCVALILALASGAYAQEFRATIKGTVADTSQAALPGATVTVQNQDTNELATAVTNGEGAYTIPFLRPGIVLADRGDERLPEEHAHEPAAFSRRDGKYQRSAGRRR